MIKSYANKETEKLSNLGKSKKFQSIERLALIKLNRINTIVKIEDLLVPPSNRLEKLKGNRQGQYSIRVNQQYRICFVWDSKDAYEVEIVDYH